MELKQQLEYTINIMQQELQSCDKELSGILEINTIHRNSFMFISHYGKKEDQMLYFDNNDSRFLQLSEIASQIEQERRVEYDKLCRKYCDIDEMISIFSQKEDNIYIYDIEAITCGKISGANLLNFARLLLSHNSSLEGFNIYNQISNEIFASDIRKESVIKEKEIFEKYIELCKEKL